jgi:hypothetical protein
MAPGAQAAAQAVEPEAELGRERAAGELEAELEVERGRERVERE